MDCEKVDTKEYVLKKQRDFLSRWWRSRTRSSPPLTNTTKPQLTAELPSIKKDWRLPKEIFLNWRQKKELQWDGRRGAIGIIGSRTPGWATHKLEGNDTAEALPQE